MKSDNGRATGFLRVYLGNTAFLPTLISAVDASAWFALAHWRLPKALDRPCAATTAAA